MKRTISLAVSVISVALVVLPALWGCSASAPPTPTPVPKVAPVVPPTPAATAKPAASPSVAPAKSPLPQVPVTYASDTDATIIRRAQWVEGAKKEGGLMWWSSQTPAECGQIIAEFNKIYPFIKVEFWNGKGEERASKLEAEYTSGKYTVDVGGGEFENYPRWRQLGILEKFIDIAPGADKWDKRSYSSFGDWANPGPAVCTPQYNTKLVAKADAPKNWDDLLDPKWKGKIGLATDVKVWVSLAVEVGGWGVDKTDQFLTKLKAQNLIWGAGHSATHALLIAGEFGIHAEDMLDNFIMSQAQGAPVDWVRANPAVPMGSAEAMMKKGPHPNAARLWMEWLMSPQGLLVYEKANGKGMVSPGAGTRAAKLLEGMNLVYRTEDGVVKAQALDLFQRYNKLLGITK